MHWFPSLSGYYFRTKILRQKIPLIASFKLTYRCNLVCVGCPFHLRAGGENSDITWGGALKAIELLSRQGCRIVVFEGGEPLLWKDGNHTFSDLICLAKKYFLKIAVTTNGTFPLDVPADILWVSLDGLRDTHDRLRSGSFDKVWENLQRCRHPKLMVHFTLNRSNMHEIEEFLMMIKKAPVVKGVTFQMFYPYGQGEKNLSLSQDQRKTVLEQVIHFKKRGYPVFNSINSLKSMISNNWRCDETILINVDPDGSVTKGCYAKNRGDIRCSECGFTPVAEATGALRFQAGSIKAGWEIFLAR